MDQGARAVGSVRLRDRTGNGCGDEKSNHQQANTGNTGNTAHGLLRFGEPLDYMSALRAAPEVQTQVMAS